MRYRIRHTTDCSYTDDIQHAQHVLHLNPRPLPQQVLHVNKIGIEPQPETLIEHIDYFGNPVTYIALETPHRNLTVRVDFEVEVAPLFEFHPGASPAWETIREEARLAATGPAKEASLFIFASEMIPPLPALGDYALPSFTPGRPIGEAAFDLIARIHTEFVFDPVATTIGTPLVEVLTNRRGVCQDFAHLAVGCLRAMGLPARYVSGYLRTVPPPGQKRLVGADATHAWISVWCGGDIWLDLDPTNGVRGSTDMVTLAWGRDYDDVSPMRGVLIGGGSQGLSVEVDVEPLDAT